MSFFTNLKEKKTSLFIYFFIIHIIFNIRDPSEKEMINEDFKKLKKLKYISYL